MKTPQSVIQLTGHEQKYPGPTDYEYIKCAQLYNSQGNENNMYGMLLESVQHFIQKVYGEEIWNKVLEHANMRNTVFTPHARYCDSTMIKIAEACSFVNGDRTPAQYTRYFGNCFVGFFTNYGYDRILKVSGRYFRDLLHGIDNLHETMRFSYPKMRNPSFYVDHEDTKGCILHYRSKRKGFSQYVAGQLEQCAKIFYNMDIEIVILKEDISAKGCHVTYRLNFDNSAFKPKSSMTSGKTVQYKTISTHFFFKIFPFCIVFNEKLQITHTGQAIKQLFAHETLIGANIKDKFTLRRPLMEFTWNNILCLQRVVFELKSVIHTRYSISKGYLKTLLLKGEMKYNKDFSGITYLCTPLMSGVEELQAVGLFINDLNMYDSSREMVIAGSQHASRLELSIEKQVAKSEKIEESLKRLDLEKQKSEDLLYSMIPQSIAVRLKNGENPINTCEVFQQVTIMFTYIVGFTDMCSSMSALHFVKCINSVFQHFDNVLDKHDVFKVETLGDAVYMIAGGLPERKPNHAYKVACVAIELLNHVKTCSVAKEMPIELQIRTGIHTGSVVAGVVGKRMPQYCLFGDTVNTASRMQTHSQSGRIHISEHSYKCLKGTDLVTVYRGKIHMKGKGDMKTYWLAGHKTDGDLNTTIPGLKSEAATHKLKPMECERTKDSFDFRKIDTIIDLRPKKYCKGQYNLNREHTGILPKFNIFPVANLNQEKNGMLEGLSNSQITKNSLNIDKTAIFHRIASVPNNEAILKTGKLPRIATHPSTEGRKFMPRTASHPWTYINKLDYGSMFNPETYYDNRFNFDTFSSFVGNTKSIEHNGINEMVNGESAKNSQSAENDGKEKTMSIIDYSYFDPEEIKCPENNPVNKSRGILMSKDSIEVESVQSTPKAAASSKKQSQSKTSKNTEEKKFSGKVRSTFSGILSHCSFSLCIDSKLNHSTNKSSENLICSPSSANSEDILTNPESSDDAVESDYLLAKLNRHADDNREPCQGHSKQNHPGLRRINLKRDSVLGKEMKHAVSENIEGNIQSNKIAGKVQQADYKFVTYPNEGHVTFHKTADSSVGNLQHTSNQEHIECPHKPEFSQKPELSSSDKKHSHSATSRVNGDISEISTLNGNTYPLVHYKAGVNGMNALCHELRDQGVQATQEMKTVSTSCDNIATVKNQYVQTV